MQPVWQDRSIGMAKPRSREQPRNIPRQSTMRPGGGELTQSPLFREADSPIQIGLVPSRIEHLGRTEQARALNEPL